MSTSHRTSDSIHENRWNNGMTLPGEPQSEAPPTDSRNVVKEFLDSLHLQPGEAVPEWFEECPWCSGRTCEACDGTGRIHPRRAGYIEDYLVEAWSHYGEFLALLKRGGVELPRVNRAIGTLGSIMGDFLEEWQAEDPRLTAVLKEIHNSWRKTPRDQTGCQTDPDNTASGNA